MIILLLATACQPLNRARMAAPINELKHPYLLSQLGKMPSGVEYTSPMARRVSQRILELKPDLNQNKANQYGRLFLKYAELYNLGRESGCTYRLY